MRRTTSRRRVAILATLTLACGRCDRLWDTKPQTIEQMLWPKCREMNASGRVRRGPPLGPATTAPPPGSSRAPGGGPRACCLRIDSQSTGLPTTQRTNRAQGGQRAPRAAAGTEAEERMQGKSHIVLMLKSTRQGGWSSDQRRFHWRVLSVAA